VSLPDKITSEKQFGGFHQIYNLRAAEDKDELVWFWCEEDKHQGRNEMHSKNVPFWWRLMLTVCHGRASSFHRNSIERLMFAWLVMCSCVCISFGWCLCSLVSVYHWLMPLHLTGTVCSSVVDIYSSFRLTIYRLV